MKHLSRRNFLKRGALLGATASLAPQILSADTLGLNGRVGPNSRINVGFIGMGGMMASHLRLSQMPGVHPLYICDVRQNRLDWGTQQMANRNTIHHIVDATEVAYVIAFLASPKSISINGDAIAAGGGIPRAIHY
jgi:hypothetical protein